MKKLWMRKLAVALVAAVIACGSVGCLSVKTQHEIKPIEITMNIKLSMDNELDRYFGGTGEEN